MEEAGRTARIIVNDGARVFSAEEGRPLLFALMAEKLFIPSACGGKASCGQCRVRVVSGAAGYVAEELRHVSESDREKGIHLSCQVRVRGEMRVEIAEERLRARQYRARVAAFRDLAPGMREIVLRLEGGQEMSFKAGQYVQFLVPGTEGDPQPVYRAYSIASSPSSKELLTLVFGRVPGGACSTYAFERLAVGQDVTINGPFGDFFLREGDRDVLLVAGGSGMAPLRGILLDMAERGSTRAVTFFYTAHAAQDLVYLDEMAALEKRLPAFRFVPVLSRPRAEDRWRGAQGSIAAVLAGRLSSLRHHEAYLCGGPGMIDASIGALRTKGLTDDRIFYDKFS